MSLVKTLKSEIAPAVQKELNMKNPMSVPTIDKVIVQVGIGKLATAKKEFSDVVENVAKITGQKPVIQKAKKAVSNFKLREGVPVAVMATLRGEKAVEFIDRLVNIALPRVRDFRGLNPKSFDGRGNYSIGFREALVFPEINPDNVINVHGLQISIATTAQNDEEGKALLTAMGFPFKKPVVATETN